MIRFALALGALSALVASPLSAEIPGAVIVLDAPSLAPGTDAKAAPPARLVLLKDGQVFVGGSAGYEAGRLEKAEQQALRRTTDVLRKAAGRTATVAVGPDGAAASRLRLPDDDNAEITLTGDPAQAAPAQAPLAAAALQLLRFNHPSLQPYKPPSYALKARPEDLGGGCRDWSFAFPIEEALAAPRAVSAQEAQGWPTGAWPASVCFGGKRYVVTLRPLLPGEQP